MKVEEEKEKEQEEEVEEVETHTEGGGVEDLHVGFGADFRRSPLVNEGEVAGRPEGAEGGKVNRIELWEEKKQEGRKEMT